ncbi:MAG: hypothetical protein V2I33_23530 [Kangiellaceae bacterium]|nr:hypothetical protein [Kangiellaceae bacterium]
MEGLKPPAALETDSIEAWVRWKQRFLIYLKASGVKNDDERCLSLLLHVIGEDGLELYNTFAVGDEKFDDVIKRFDEHFKPRTNEVFERFRFWERNQQDGEPIDLFVTDLKRLAASCNFDTQKDKMIRDKIVLGGNSAQVRERLLREEDLSLQEAIRICRAAESTKKQMKAVEKSLHVVRSHSRNPTSQRQAPQQMASQVRGANSSRCHSCGYSHPEGRCPAQGKRCMHCNRFNHFRSCCPDNKQKVMLVEADDSDNPDESQHFYIGSLTDSSSVEWFLEVQMPDGGVMEFKVDTGAQVNVIPVGDLPAGVQLESTRTLLTAFGGSRIPVTGKCRMRVTIRGRTALVTFMVAESDSRLWGCQLSIQWVSCGLWMPLSKRCWMRLLCCETSETCLMISWAACRTLTPSGLTSTRCLL